MTLDDTLFLFGYKPEDNSWDTDGRCTYIHNESADKSLVNTLAGALYRRGWDKHPTKLRTFEHCNTHEIIEIEPGGADASGHYLHIMKAEVA